MSLGDVYGHFYDFNPSEVYKRQIAYTASVYLRNNAGSFDNPTQALQKAESVYENGGGSVKDKFEKMLGIGALMAHFTKTAGENTVSLHDKLRSGGRFNNGCNELLPATDPLSCSYNSDEQQASASAPPQDSGFTSPPEEGGPEEIPINK